MLQGTLDPISNRSDWVVSGTVTDPASGDALVDLSGATIVMHITREESPRSPLITLSTDDGTITVTGAGTYAFTVTKEQLACLCEGRHKIFINITAEDITDPLLIADLPIIEGGPA